MRNRIYSSAKYNLSQTLLAVLINDVYFRSSLGESFPVDGRGVFAGVVSIAATAGFDSISLLFFAALSFPPSCQIKKPKSSAVIIEHCESSKNPKLMRMQFSQVTFTVAQKWLST